ncbi:EKC/KEOPS complex subunit TPRKB [Zea mays]|uniref:PRPK n=2 Tax=Zea mays TaxID=4577 RepID=A0A1D6MLM9_MAIZE|nr:PRPK [Zea mays]PWZ30355.1 EKC/KEOPS complex subunit TPRKB [Zea mays]
MKTFPLSRGSTISLALFSDVSNSRELLDLMQSGKLEPAVALLNASLVPDVFPILAAALKALLSKTRESLTTRTLHSELVYNYSGSKHVIDLAAVGAFALRVGPITESLKRCGISDNTTYILAACFDASDEEMKAVEKLISGTEIDLTELERRANQPQILKHYKIPPQELSISTLPDAIVCRIAARDAL